MVYCQLLIYSKIYNKHMDFTKKFAELLKYENINQTELAKKLNVSKQAITNLKNGSSLPSLELLCAIALELNVTTDYLLGIRDESGRKTYANNSYNNFTNYGSNFGNINITNK